MGCQNLKVIYCNREPYERKIELSTDHPLYSKVKSRASFIGATAANQSASSLVDITNSGVFNTAPWESLDGYIVSPQIGNSEKTALIIEGIPAFLVNTASCDEPLPYEVINPTSLKLNSTSNISFLVP